MVNESKCTECEKNEVCKFIHEYCDIIEKAEKELKNPIVIASIKCRYFKHSTTIRANL